jgi:hypothetical protein
MVGFGTTNQRPSNPANGFLFYDTTLQGEYVYNDGSGWQVVAPPASVVYPTHYTLVSSGGATTRTAYLAAGTWQLSLQTMGYDNDSGGNSNIQVSQVGAITGIGIVTTSFTALRTGGSGFGRNVGMGAIAVSNVVVSPAGTYTLSIAAVSTSGSQTGNWVSTGSVLMCEKLS